MLRFFASFLFIVLSMYPLGSCSVTRYDDLYLVEPGSVVHASDNITFILDDNSQGYYWLVNWSLVTDALRAMKHPIDQKKLTVIISSETQETEILSRWWLYSSFES